MNPTNRAIAIVGSVIVIAVCLVCALAYAGHSINLTPGGRSIDETKTAELGTKDNLTIDSSFSSVNVSTDPGATSVTAHLYGSVYGLNLGEDSLLEVTRSGSTVTVRAGKNWRGALSWNSRMKLDIVLPAEFAGSFDCSSSAGAVSIDSDMAAKSFRAHSSAGAVRTRNIKCEGNLEISSSAGEVQAGDIEAGTADIHSSAGRVQVDSCKAQTVRLHASAGSISAGSLSGKLDVSSSAGSVTVGLGEVADSADISSSAGSVTVSLPGNASYDLNAWTSAGSVSVSGVQLSSIEEKKRDRVQGKVGEGGPEVKIHSSAGSVNVSAE